MTDGRIGGALDVTWGRTLSVWWLILWRVTALTLIGAIIIGGVAGFLTGVAGGSEQDSALAGGVAGSLLGLVLGLWTIRMALRKRYRDFEIVLIASPDADARM